MRDGAHIQGKATEMRQFAPPVIGSSECLVPPSANLFGDLKRGSPVLGDRTPPRPIGWVEARIGAILSRQTSCRIGLGKTDGGRRWPGVAPVTFGVRGG